MASKYKVDTTEKGKKKRTYNEIIFDSEMEMKYYRDILCPLKESGELVYIELQKNYELQPKFVYNDKSIKAITYVADFYVKHKSGEEEVIEIKGVSTPVAALKRKMFEYKYPNIKYTWLTYVKKYGGWLEFDYVKKIRNENNKAKRG